MIPQTPVMTPASVAMPTRVNAVGATLVNAVGAIPASVATAIPVNVVPAILVTAAGLIPANAPAGNAMRPAAATRAVGSASAIPVRTRTASATTCATAHGASIRSAPTTTSATASVAHSSVIRCAKTTTRTATPSAPATTRATPMPTATTHVRVVKVTHVSVGPATRVNAVGAILASVAGDHLVTAASATHASAMRIVTRTARATSPTRPVVGTAKWISTICSTCLGTTALQVGTSMVTGIPTSTISSS